MKWTYLLINAGIVAGPLWLSRDRQIAYHRNFFALASATLIVGGLFILWDVFATARGEWSFNPVYITGMQIANLPIEEIAFFVTVPYACLFIYEVVLRSARAARFALPAALPWSAVAALLGAAWLFVDQGYTFKAMLSCAMVVALSRWLDPELLSSRQYWLWIAICLIPFAVVNTILTALPVVRYDSEAIWGLRLGTIPAEDLFYNFALLSSYLLFYRWAGRRRSG